MGPALMANPRIYPNLRWSEKSFIGVGVMAWAPAAMTVNPGSSAKTVKEFIELAKTTPGGLNYGNAGVGSSVHLNTAIFMNGTQTKITSVPYKGQPPAILDMLSDRVHLMFASIGLVAQHVQDKKLKALAVIGTKRSPLLPDVPTMTEAGYPEINVVPWYGLAVPRGVPQPIVEKIVAGINEALKDPNVRIAAREAGAAAGRTHDLATDRRADRQGYRALRQSHSGCQHPDKRMRRDRLAQVRQRKKPAGEKPAGLFMSEERSGLGLVTATAFLVELLDREGLGGARGSNDASNERQRDKCGYEGLHGHLRGFAFRFHVGALCPDDSEIEHLGRY